MTSFLTSRSLRIKLESLLSNEVPVPSRIPQGSEIGPIVFLVMLKDLPGLVSQLCFLLVDDAQILGEHHAS